MAPRWVSGIQKSGVFSRMIGLLVAPILPQPIVAALNPLSDTVNQPPVENMRLGRLPVHRHFFIYIAKLACRPNGIDQKARRHLACDDGIQDEVAIALQGIPHILWAGIDVRHVPARLQRQLLVIEIL